MTSRTLHVSDVDCLVVVFGVSSPVLVLALLCCSAPLRIFLSMPSFHSEFDLLVSLISVRVTLVWCALALFLPFVLVLPALLYCPSALIPLVSFA